MVKYVEMEWGWRDLPLEAKRRTNSGDWWWLVVLRREVL